MKEYEREFSIIHRYSRIYMSRAMGELDVSGRLLPYIMLISENPGTSQGTIANEFHIDKGSVARTIALLIDKGLVDKKENPENKRENLVYPTKKMLDISDKVKEANSELNAVLNRGFSEEEIEELSRLLSRMAGNLIEALGKEGCCGDKVTELP